MMKRFGTALAGTVSALLAFTPAASAGVTGDAPSGACQLATGLPGTAAGALQSAGNCLKAPPEGVRVREDVARDLATLVNRRREKLGLDPLELRPAFSSAAGIHAMDQAVRGYAAQTDLEGRGHEYRLRLLDRRALISASGAVVAVLPGTMDAVGAYNAILTDPVNAQNLVREEFSHLGLSTIEKDGRLYTVILLAQLEGELDVPMPARVSAPVDLGMSLVDSRLRFDRWQLENAGGQRMDIGLNPRLGRTQDGAVAAYLDLHVTDGRDVFVLKGPLVDR